MAYTIGLNGTLKIGETALLDVKDVTLNLSTGEADATTRKSAGWKTTIATLKEASIDFTVVYDATSAGITALQTAFIAGTSVDVEITGTGTFSAACAVTGFNISQPLEDVITVAITLKPTEAPTFTVAV